MPAKPYSKPRRLGSARRAVALAWLGAALFAPAHAGGLGVSPVLIDLRAGETVAAVQVQNLDAVQPVSVQVRVVRWQQGEAGEEVYTPTDAVLASPPMTLVLPGAENLVRIVRTAKAAPQGEESYRLLIDQLPAPGEQRSGTVQMLVRHAVPVFFSHPKATPAQIDWRIERVLPTRVAQDARPPGWRVSAQNRGERRLRLVDVALRDADGRTVAQRAGLIGYVLGHSRTSFFVPDVGPEPTQDTASTGGQNASTPTPAALRLSLADETGVQETGLLPVIHP